MVTKSTPEIEINLLLEAIFQKYGYDFREYSRAHITRRINTRLSMSRMNSISEMQARVLHDHEFASQILQDFSITITEMFRDPEFYMSLRKNVIPILKTYSFIKVWHAGAATGEEAYSVAILLKEEGLLDRCTIYATDFNQKALDKAREGIFPISLVKEYTRNYQKAGGTEAFSDYYTADSEQVIMDKTLKKNIVWANHNLVTDSVFAEVNLILCRNVLIYFNKELQNKVHKLFFDSLMNGGILCLGTKESMRFSNYAGSYKTIDGKTRIFKKSYQNNED